MLHDHGGQSSPEVRAQRAADVRSLSKSIIRDLFRASPTSSGADADLMCADKSASSPSAPFSPCQRDGLNVRCRHAHRSPLSTRVSLSLTPAMGGLVKGWRRTVIKCDLDSSQNASAGLHKRSSSSSSCNHLHTFLG